MRIARIAISAFLPFIDVRQLATCKHCTIIVKPLDVGYSLYPNMQGHLMQV
jgi:hypothetical protein